MCACAADFIITANTQCDIRRTTAAAVHVKILLSTPSSSPQLSLGRYTSARACAVALYTSSYNRSSTTCSVRTHFHGRLVYHLPRNYSPRLQIACFTNYYYYCLLFFYFFIKPSDFTYSGRARGQLAANHRGSARNAGSSRSSAHFLFRTRTRCTTKRANCARSSPAVFCASGVSTLLSSVIFDVCFYIFPLLTVMAV